MGRLHLFEFNDLKGLPLAVRKTQTEFLTAFSLLFKVYNKPFDKLAKRLKEKKVKEIQALCAGDGGIIENISRHKDYQNITFVLSDLYPDSDRFRAIKNTSDGNIDFIEKPIDVHNIPLELKGLRLIINAVHHFKPQQVKELLADAAENKQPIVFFEPIQRNPIALLKVLLVSPLFCVLISLGFFLPFNFRRLVTGLLIPVASFTFIFDGIISHLRAYTADEFKLMSNLIENSGDFNWETGYFKGIAGSRVTYLIGFPKEKI